MSKPNYIELPTGERIPILYEDRSVIAIDKPRGWMLAPFSWQKTSRNLQAALTSSIAAKDFWARSRGLKYLRFVHRLDADTTGILLLAKSVGAVTTYGELFESRKMEKVYLAVVQGAPTQQEWTCRLKLGPDANVRGKTRVDPQGGKEAESHFRVLQSNERTTLIKAYPLTGRTHQIRVHLAESGHPVVGDELYGIANVKTGPREQQRTPHPGPLPLGRGEGAAPLENLGLRAISLAYTDPFTRRWVQIRAPSEEFLREYGFERRPNDE